MILRYEKQKRYFCLLIIVSILSVVGCALLYRHVSDVLDIETTTTLTKKQLVTVADTYASRLDIDVAHSFKLFTQGVHTVDSFVMTQSYGAQELARRKKMGLYNPEYFSIKYNNVPWSGSSETGLILNDHGSVQSFLITAPVEPAIAHKQSYVLQLIESVIPHFSQEYSRQGYSDLGQSSTTQQQNSWQIYFTNKTKETFSTVGYTYPNTIYFVSYGNLSNSMVQQAENKWFQSRVVGAICIIVSLFLLLLIVWRLRKKIPVRDRRCAHYISLALSFVLLACIITDCYHSLPLEPTVYQYLLMCISALPALFMLVITYYLFRFIIGFAESITRAVLQHHIPLAQSLTTYVLSSYQGMRQLIAAYLHVPVLLLSIMITFWIAIQRGWIISPAENYSFLSFFKTLFISLRAGILEEAVFRGMMLGGMLWYVNQKERYKTLLTIGAVCVQAVLFAGVHNLSLYEPVYAHALLLIPAGVVFAVIYLSFGLFTAMLSHALYDFLLLTAHQTNDLMFSLASVFVVIFPLLLLLVARIRMGRWHSLTDQNNNDFYVPKN